jgi:predicted amidohydrolase YtcJ
MSTSGPEHSISGGDLIIANGDIWTLNEALPAADAMAISSGRVVAVGSLDHCRQSMPPGTPEYDARGNSVIPGLVDGHAHMDREGLKAELPSLSGCTSIAEIKESIRQLVAAARPGEWIVTMPLGTPPDFRGMPESLAEGRWPTRWDLDEVAPNNPVYIKSIWGYWRHTLPLVSIANSKALEIAGIKAGTAPPLPTVEIEKDEKSGEPTGIFIENNFMPIVEFTLMRCAPRFSASQRLSGLKRSMAIYNSFGTTGVYEGHGVANEVLSAYQSLRDAGPLPVRSHLVLSPRWHGATAETVQACLSDWLGWLKRRGLGDDTLRVQGIYAEPGITEENSLRAEAGGCYTGWAGFYYDAGLPPDALNVLMGEAAAAGIRVSAMGIDMLSAFACIEPRPSIAAHRWVIEHIAWVSPDQIAMARDLGIVMTTHTNRYIWKEGPLLLEQSPDRDPNELVPLRRLLDAGVPVCLATDNVPPSLFHPLSHAVSRMSRDGRPVAPDQAITLTEALNCNTRTGAYLCFAEQRRGAIEPGFDADIVILDKNLHDISLTELADTKASKTIVAGKTVYQR